jgi:predicted DNA binding protein
MSIVAEFTIDGNEFLLGEVLAWDPVAHIEMERVVPASRRIMPYVWVHGDELDQFEASLRTSKHVLDLTQLDQINGSALYRIDWEDKAEDLIDGIAETNATILEARGKEEWFFRIRFDSHAKFVGFNEFCQQHNISIKLNQLTTLTDREALPRFELTDSQQETVFQAVRDGYFEVPRRTTLDEVGSKLGISQQTASENLRRGTNKVLKNLLSNSS